MRKMKLSNVFNRVLAMFLTVIMVGGILISSIDIKALADTIANAVKNTGASSSADVVISSKDALLKVTPLNAKTTRGTKYAEAQTYAYPQDGYVTFRVSLVYNGQDYGGKSLPDGWTLENNITFSYRTYDLSAVASSGDYTAINGTHTFVAGSGNAYYDFSVAVNPTTFGTYYVSDRMVKFYRDYNDYNYSLMEYAGVYECKQNYISRSFGFQIFDLENAELYHTADSKTGVNVYYDHALGTLPVNFYYAVLPWLDGGYDFAFYHINESRNLSSFSMTRDSVNVSKVYIKQADWGRTMSTYFIQTGLAHYYMTGHGKQDGSDASQRDSYVGLIYDGYENATSITDKDLMLKLKRGIVTLELDGYPDNEFFHFFAFNNSEYTYWCGHYGYSGSEDEVEWSEACYQFEKYVCNNYGHGTTDGHSSLITYYKVEGDPEWVGMTAQREKYGENRVVKDGQLTLTLRDDSPVKILETFIDDTSLYNNTQNDTLRIMVRFSEPMQINPSKLPELVCGFNTTNITSAQSPSAARFKYEYGAGSDTLVFSYKLSNLPSTAVIDQVQIYYMTNADQVTDFSSLDSIYITSKKDGTSTVLDAIDEKNNIVTKKSGTRWSVAKTYFGSTGLLTDPALIGPITLKFTKSIDPRQPSIVDISDDNSGKTAKNHTATITLNTSGLDVAVYAHWTEDLNGQTGTSIPRPETYTESERIVATSSNSRYFKATVSLEGTVYLWVRVVTAFGKVDERLCGPFYFDKSADTVTDIHVTEGSLSSQSKVKTLQFTVDHSTDYISCSGDNIFKDGTNSETKFLASNIELSELYLVYSTDSLWGAGSAIESKLLYSSKFTSRKLTAKVAATKADYVYKFGFSSTNLADDETVQTTDSFIQKNVDGSSKKVTYITKVTYQIDIGYDKTNDINDFDLVEKETDYKKVYIGFKTTDMAGNTKVPTSSEFVAGKDYVNNQYAQFDIRSVREASISYSGANSALPTDKATKTVVDSTVNVYPTSTPLTVKFSFSDTTRLMNSEISTSGYEIQVYVKKANSLITETNTEYDNPSHLLSSWGKQTLVSVTVSEGDGFKTVQVPKDGSFVGNVAEVLSGGSPKTQYTSWFSWTLSDATGSGADLSYNSITLTTYPMADIPDLCGYYEVYFSFKDTKGNATYTPSATFYLGNNENKTENVTELKEGTLFTNKVFRLPAESRYYYQTVDDTIQNPYYAVGGGALTFSSEEIARKYLLFKECQDLYLYQIPSQEIADSLNQKSGNKTRSDYDISNGKMAVVGQWWIRYKMKTWSYGSTENTGAWIYYFYNDSPSTPTIKQIEDLPTDLYVALNTVVNTILATGSTVLLSGEENLNKYGSPSIPATCIRSEPETVDKTLCNSVFKTSLSFQGDSAIYSDSVLFDEGGVTKEYNLASTAVLNISGKTRVYITPYDGDYAGIWGQVPSGTNILLKETLNTIYRQILIAAGNDASMLGTVSAPSGRYTVFEIDENGYSSTTVYIDKTAPQINFEYTVFGEDGKAIPASKYYTRGNESGLVIHGVSFTLRGIGSYGAVSGYVDEIDDYAYVVVYNSTRTKTLYAMTVEDLRLKNPKITEEGSYCIEVWDRSGNTYSFTVNLAAKQMKVSLTTDDGARLKVQNRDASQIAVFEVKRDGVTIDTTFAASKTYSENGLYSVRIVDRFGMEYTGEIKFSREIPLVTWRTNGDNAIISENTDGDSGSYSSFAKLVRVDSVTYNVITSVPVSFRYSTAAGIAVELLSGATDEDFTITPSQFTTYMQKDMKEFSVKLFYKNHTNVYVIYHVVVDTVAPAIDVEYDHYSFESVAERNAMLQLLENPDQYVDGQIVTPNRIDFSMLSATTLKVLPGASIYTNEARLSIMDSSGISRLIISLNGTTLYDGAYSESGDYTDKNGNACNYNFLTEIGQYKITAFDALGNRSEFSFTNTSSNVVTYMVDGVEYFPYYDYVYDTDVGGKIILDETGAPIIKEKWLFLKKFKTDENQTVDPKYLDKSTKESLGNYFSYDKTFTYVQYGNTAQTVNVLGNNDIQILLTYEDLILMQDGDIEKLVTVTCHRFIGVKVVGNDIYLYHYTVDASDDDGISVGEEIMQIPVVSLSELLVGMPRVIYSFDSEIENGYSLLGMNLTVTYQKNGSITFSLNASTDSSLIVTSEVKVSQSDGAFEPSYFKTVLSLYESGVEITNENGAIEITEDELGSGQWKYTNGEKISVNVDADSDPYLIAVLISFSKTMTPGEYDFLYSTDPSIATKDFYGNGDGYYFVKTVNVFGNEKIYRLAISNSLLVSTVADYLDGWTRPFSTEDTCDVNANKSVTISFKKDGSITYSVKKGGLAILPNQEEKNGAVILTFTEEGDYCVTVSDQYGNVVVRNIHIKSKTLKLPSNILLNPQTKALRYSENYTNMKVSVNATLLEQYGIRYVAVEKKGSPTLVLMDKISAASEQVTPTSDSFTDCIGQAGDGDYTVLFRDATGNLFKTVVHYRETPTLMLTRMTTSSEKAEAYSLTDALNPDVQFISNHSLFFNTEASNYIFSVAGQTLTCPYKIAFTNVDDKGRISYDIEYLDEYGFSYQFTAVLYRADVQLELDPSVSSVTVDGVLMTNENIRVVYSSNATCYYQLEGSDYVEFPAGSVLKKDGSYVIYAEDFAGNFNFFTVTKDSVVEYSFRESRYGKKIENGMITNSENVFFQAENGDNATVKVAFLNGEKIEGDTNNFQKNGKWEVVVTDVAGNESLYTFFVYTHEINRLDFYEPQDYSFTDIWYSATGTGKVSMVSSIVTNDDGNRHFLFERAGTYSVMMNSNVTGVAATFTLEISEKMPEATLSGVEDGGSTIGSVSLLNTKKDDTVYIYKNGSDKPTVYNIAYDGERIEISEEGEYVVVIKNLAENSVSYSFTRKHVANTAGSVLIILLMVVIVVGLFIGMTYRNKSKVDK